MKEILTQSRIQMRKNCAFKEHLRYNHRLVPKRNSEARNIGTAVHKGLETHSVDAALAELDREVHSQEEQDKLDVRKATVSAMLKGYWAAGFQEFDSLEPELKFSVPIRNPRTGAFSKKFLFEGKVDGVAMVDGQHWLVEYKTAGALDQSYFDKLYLDTQITSYIYGAQRALGITFAGVIYRVIRKPTIRQKQKETLDEYCKRLEADYLDPERKEFYFADAKLYRSQEDIAAFEQELWDFTQQYLFDNRCNCHMRNTSRCLDWGKCEYMPICMQEAGWEALYERREPHEELKDEPKEVA